MKFKQEMIGCLSIITIRFLLILIVGIIIVYSNFPAGNNMVLHSNIAYSQTEGMATTIGLNNNTTAGTTSNEANTSRVEGTQPDVPTIQGTGIPDEQTSANPTPEAPITGMDVKARENETEEGTGAFANFTNTTR